MQPARGTRDLWGEEKRLHNHIIEESKKVSKLYSYSEIETPIFEFTSVFCKPIGESTDVVSKEMYTFEKADESLSLRPEGTAAVTRALLSNSLLNELPLKLFYAGPMFRYERPQKGRFREFYQFGAEFFGSSSPLADVELIAMFAQIAANLGLSDKISLDLNTLGDAENYATYRQKIIDYFSRYEKDLSEDSRARLHKNPMRVLDSKEECDKKIVQGAPSILDCLNDNSAKFFDKVKENLTNLGIGYKLNPSIVRGLDYYSHTVFEFITNELGAQGTVCGGGRYDGLMEKMGGPATPAVGFAVGIDRLMLLVQNMAAEVPPIFVLAAQDVAESYALNVSQKLRLAGKKVQMPLSGNLKKRLSKADKAGAEFAVIIGEDEMNSGMLTLRNLKTGEQIQSSFENLIHKL